MNLLRKVSISMLLIIAAIVGSVIIIPQNDGEDIVAKEPSPYVGGVTAGASKSLSDSLKVALDTEITIEEDKEQTVGLEEESNLEPFDSVRSYYVSPELGLNVRSVPSADDDSTIVDTLSYNTKIEITGVVKDSDFYYIESDTDIQYVSSKYLSEEKLPEKKVVVTTSQPQSVSSGWTGQKLTRSAGTIMGPSGKETYYNLPMDGVINIMRNMGNTDPYWIREDGCKMLGSYIMVAADLSIRPRGSLVPTSLGMGIVCDTGTFIYGNNTQLDLSVNWN